MLTQLKSASILKLSLFSITIAVTAALTACDEQQGPRQNANGMSDSNDMANHAEHPAAQPTIENKQTIYVCPMHSHIVRDHEGTCPICGMDLVAKTKSIDAMVEVNVSESMANALSIKLAKVERGTIWKYIETSGQVQYDETRLVHLHPRSSGWLEKLNVNSVGDPVDKGEYLYEIYSPELLAAQSDYLFLLENANGNKSSQQIKNAELKMRLLGAPDSQIATLQKTKQPNYSVPVPSKTSGFVTKLNVRPGMYVTPTTELMTIADLSEVWVKADVFPNQSPWVEVGKSVTVKFSEWPGKEFEGKVDYIEPELDMETGGLKVRIELQNPELMLRPSMLADVVIWGGPLADRLWIPKEALIQTQANNRVVVKTDQNIFSVKEVTVGSISQGKAEILSGLKLGEQIVVSGQFLLDAESSLQGAMLRLSNSESALTQNNQNPQDQDASSEMFQHSHQHGQ